MMPTLKQVSDSIRAREIALLTAAGARDIGDTVLGSVVVTVAPGGGPVTFTRQTHHTLTREQWQEVCNGRYN